MSLRFRSTGGNRQARAAEAARAFPNVASGFPATPRDQDGSDPRALPSTPASAEPSAMAPGVRRSGSQIVGSRQDAAHPHGPESAIHLSTDVMQALQRRAKGERCCVGKIVRMALSDYLYGPDHQVALAARLLDDDLARGGSP
ncbi:MAG: hypothetical protein M9944_07875 [Rhizobiaceae bacterium]|nr:hypothetical protein [Rhizobiaceae bacterium]